MIFMKVFSPLGGFSSPKGNYYLAPRNKVLSSKHHGFRHLTAQLRAMKRGRFTGKSARFGL